MKKGCFVQTIILLTVLTAVVVYIIQNHFDELILSPGKKVLTGIMMNEFDDKFSFVHPSAEKDSFKVLLGDMLQYKIEKEKEISSDEFKEFFESINHIFADSIIDKSELEELKTKALSLK
jgi:hypothetical protein